VGSAFLITLREGLEISLVVAIIAAYLVKTGNGGRLPAMWLGVAVAAVVCIVSGVAFDLLIGEFDGTWEQAIEGTLAFSAAGVLTWMIFWMRRNARNLSGELHARIDAALGRSPLALGVVSFVAVAREGFETMLFLIGAQTTATSGSAVVVGGLIGLFVSAVIGVAFYAGSAKVDLRRFFQTTGMLLILFAAGLFAKGLHEYRELLGIEWSPISTAVWNISSGPLAEGSAIHDFLKGLFGWSPNPERLTVVGYFAYLIPVTWFFYRDTQPELEGTTTESERSTVGSRSA
jgi:high-affinity iron transporter